MKKMKAMLTALAMLAAIPLSLSQAMVADAGVSEIPAGVYMIRNVNSGLYLNVAGGVAAENTNVEQWEATSGVAGNAWKITNQGDGYYKIYSMLDGGDQYCLHVSAASSKSGENLSIAAPQDTDQQLYQITGNADGSFKLLTKGSGGKQAIEVKNAETTNGANVQQWEINGVNCQDWELVPLRYVEQSALREIVGTVKGGESIAAGDWNGDGVINVLDLALSKYLLRSNTATPEQKFIGNFDDNAEFTLSDLVGLQKYLVGMRKQQLITLNGIRTYPAVNGSYEKGVTETTNEGFVSDSYLNMYNEKDTDVSWNVKADTEGVYAVTFRYANGAAGSRNVQLLVNNELMSWELEFPTTEAWTQWNEATVNLPLKQGTNQITAISLTDLGAPNLDTLVLKKTDQAVSTGKPLEALVGEAAPLTQENKDGRQMEALNRGVIAAYDGKGMLVSWRSLATDPENTTFKLYKNGELVKSIAASEATNYYISGATAADTITVDTYVGTTCTEQANKATVLGTKNSGQSGAYMDIPLSKPAAQTMPDGSTCTYSPNDCSVGDVDGDGEYEIILKWDPSNSKDNSQSGYTGTVFLDCYKLNGKQLWRIDLGKNIRAGAHYTQFMVYDFDGDGKAELMCKTADGTVDGKGKTIGDASKDYRSGTGTVLSGPEFLTLFDGATGANLHTIDFEPSRGKQDKATWQDDYGNRSERYLAGVAYFDGKKPSAVFSRGYYTRTAVTAYDIVDKKIVKRWGYDTGFNPADPAYGQGNHSVVVMDVDSDGKDELIYGSCCFDDDGTLKWSTKLGHGDCMQAGDLIPERPGLEVFQVHEEVWCAEVHDAATGEILWKVDGGDDVGRGIALNMSKDTPGMEFTSIADGKVYYYNPSTKKIEPTGYYWNDKIKWGMNAAVWWDGDLEREALDRTMAEKPGATGPSRVFTGDGASYNNASKSNASLTCDLFGDWREEMIFPANDGTTLRVFGTTFATDTKLFTLMHDSQYRTGVAIENVAYNQAPNTSFFLGTGYPLPKTPQVYTAK